MSAKDYPSMVDAKQLKTRDLSWFRPGAVRLAVMCSGHYIAQHRGACSGAATSRMGEEAWPPSPWWSGWRCCGRIGERVSGALNVVCCLVSCVPCGRGVHLPFIGQGEGELQACRTIQLHGKYGVQRRRVGGRLDGPCRDLAIMAYLVPEQW
jgi:hypothetical protein